MKHEKLKKDFKDREEKLNTSVTQQAIKIQNQKTKIENCEHVINDLQDQASMFRAQCKVAEKRARKLEIELTKLKTPEVQKDNSVETLEDELKGVKLSLHSKIRELDSMSHELASSKASKESMSQACRKTERTITQLRADLERAARAEEVAQDQVIMLRKELSSANQEKDSLFVTSKETEEEGEKLKSKIKELERRLKVKENQFNQNEEYNSLKKETLSDRTTKGSTKTEEVESDLSLNQSIMEINNQEDDYTSSDLLDVRHLCRSREDDPIARLLRKIKEQIDEDERVSQMIYSLNSIQNKELI